MSSLLSLFSRSSQIKSRVLPVSSVRANFALYSSSTSDSSPSKTTKKVKTKKGKTPKGKFDDNYDEARPSYAEKEPLKKHPNNVNQSTGEAGGPAGPEPTRLVKISISGYLLMLSL